jgi:hypothetical protein
MYVQRDTEARSRNHFCRGKAISITYFFVTARRLVFACARVCVCGSRRRGRVLACM